MVEELNSSLHEQTASTAALLELPARLASPVILEPSFSLGPEAVTDSVRAQEKAADRAERVETGEPPPNKVAPKKTKPIPPE